MGEGREEGWQEGKEGKDAMLARAVALALAGGAELSGAYEASSPTLLA